MKRYIRSETYDVSDLEPDEDYGYSETKRRKSDAEYKQEAKECLSRIDFIKLAVSPEDMNADAQHFRMELNNTLIDATDVYYNEWYAVELLGSVKCFVSVNQSGTIKLQFLNGSCITITKRTAKSERVWYTAFDMYKFFKLYLDEDIITEVMI